MIRKRKLLIVSILLIATFVITTNYLLSILTRSETNKVRSVQEEIYLELAKLKDKYKNVQTLDDGIEDNLIRNINAKAFDGNFEKTWRVANSWVSKTGVVDLQSSYLGSVLLALKTSKIIKADLDTRGTQLKLLLTLQGFQDVIFKPKWYNKTTVIEGPVYAGKDRYGSEIIGFYLSAILNMPRTPCSVERNISFSREIIPVATKRLIATSFSFHNRTCIYGKCFYCKKEDPICEDENLSLSGTVIFNINASFKSYRSPWQRTYKQNKKAVWEESNNYCKMVKEKMTKRRLLDLIDTSVFDFLIQNGDRHHYETLYENVMLMDNGKGFGNPNVCHIDILAPLYQCCLLRSSTLEKLETLAGGVLRKKLEAMPDVENFISAAHLKAIEERLLIVFSTVEYCKNAKNKKKDATLR